MSYSIGGNFVCGRPSEFLPKPGFDEGESWLNGGDPDFVDIANPLGADGVPFTADDGLRLRSTSKLIGAGIGGLSIGAYQEPVASVVEISVSRSSMEMLRVGWRTNGIPLRLEQADALDGTWKNGGVPAIGMNGDLYIDVPSTGSAKFFRLVE
jgi:hypothetical protein